MLERLLANHQEQSGGPRGEDPAKMLREIDEQRDELAAAWGAGEITRKEWAAGARRPRGEGQRPDQPQRPGP